MAEALAIKIRYETPGPEGETRAQRNIRFGAGDKNQSYEVPDEAGYLWDWYLEILDGFQGVVNGEAVPIPPSEFKAWSDLTGNVVLPEEYAILRRMDAARRAALSEEIAYHRAVARDKAEQATKQQTKGRRGRG